MRLLLDTHVFLWSVGVGAQLRDSTRSAIIEANVVTVSAASVWEIAIKAAAGRLRVEDDVRELLEGAGFVALAMTVEHALEAGALPPHHADPFDRMLVAQARLEGMTLVTRDPAMARYDVALLEA